MVELAEIGLILQTISVMSAATAAVIGVRSYINSNKRAGEAKQKEQETRDRELETRKLQFVTSITSQLLSEEGQRRYGELMNMEWKDYDDFERKYGSDYNLDNTAKRMSVWKTYNTLGMLVREKLIEPEVIYRINDVNPCYMWSKFKDIMPEWQKRYGGGEVFSDFEFLSDELLRIAVSKDPSFRIPETLSKYVP
jgi:hypothetical protein